jgi:hypothetical protein
MSASSRRASPSGIGVPTDRRSRDVAQLQDEVAVRGVEGLDEVHRCLERGRVDERAVARSASSGGTLGELAGVAGGVAQRGTIFSCTSVENG